MQYSEAFKKVIGHEGGYTTDYHDRGNWTSGRVGVGIRKGTNRGISAAAYPHLDIKNLSNARIKNIYYNDYWLECGCDVLPAAVRFDVFDTAVTSGVRRSIKILQRALGVKADGWAGPKTRGAIKKITPSKLDKRFNGYRMLFVTDIKTFKRYGRGWMKRIASNLIND